MELNMEYPSNHHRTIDMTKYTSDQHLLFMEWYHKILIEYEAHGINNISKDILMVIFFDAFEQGKLEGDEDCYVAGQHVLANRIINSIKKEVQL